MAITVLTNENYQKEVEECGKPVLIDFWAAWCGPCRMLSPIVDIVSEEHPEIKVCKVNVDEENALADRFKVNAIPTLVVVKDGRVTSVSAGYKTKEQILELIND